ncbi:MAG TPA: CdaR family protein [Candidatus Limnocylindrales bacterium]
MTRLLRFVFRNWPLKLAAIVLSTLLYAGLVLSQNARTWDGQVPIDVLHQPANTVLLGTLPPVTNIRYFAPLDAVNRLSADSFRANVDLAGITPSESTPIVTARVNVTVNDTRVQILDYDPQVVQVRLDPLVRKSVPVQVDRGTVPEGLQAGPPQLDVQQATAIGPSSEVQLVYAAVARVRIQPAGLDVDQDVDLIAVDAADNVISGVQFEPRSVHVRIQVASQLSSRNLPVNAVVTGTPASGYQVVGVTVEPATVSVSGDANALSPLSRVDTKPVSISGASTSIDQQVQLDLPAGVTAGGAGSVRVRIQLQSQAGTRDFSVGLVPDGARSDRTYAFSTSSVVVTLGGSLAALGAVDPTSFAATASVAGLDPGSHTVPVRVVLPAGLNLVAISPPSVTVTVGLPASPTPTPSPAPPAGP